MKTAKTDRSEVREHTLSIMLSAPEKESVEREANKMGLTMSAWARMVLKSHIEKMEN